jgi:hypothetical protein
VLSPNNSLGELWPAKWCTNSQRSKTVSCIITSSQCTKIQFSLHPIVTIDNVTNIYHCMVSSSVVLSENTSLGELWPPGCTKSNRNKTVSCTITSSQCTKMLFCHAPYRHVWLCD